MLQIDDKIVLDLYHLIVGNADIFHCIACVFQFLYNTIKHLS